MRHRPSASSPRTLRPAWPRISRGRRCAPQRPVDGFGSGARCAGTKARTGGAGTRWRPSRSRRAVMGRRVPAEVGQVPGGSVARLWPTGIPVPVARGPWLPRSVVAGLRRDAGRIHARAGRVPAVGGSGCPAADEDRLAGQLHGRDLCPVRPWVVVPCNHELQYGVGPPSMFSALDSLRGGATSTK